MPQKKNPVVIELVRAKTSNIYGNLLASLTILKALPYSYNLDLQELTHHIWESCETTLSTIKIFSHMFKKMRFNTKRLIDLAQNEMSTATELADTIVREHRIPFRSAHRIVGILVRKALTDNKRLDQVAKEDLDEIIKMTIGKSLHTPNKTIQKAFDITENVKIRSVRGGPSSNEVSRMLKKRYEALKNYNWISKKKEKLKFADNMLAEEISKLKEVIDI